MAKIKPSLPKGTRDFTPEQLARRYFIMNTIREVFELYGFQPIETPAMENLETLTGKYGEEGDKLLFRILNSGDFLLKADEKALADKDSNKLSSSISEKGLRYDLTIPFARYVVMHQHEITFPFRRYQMQPVWRADRPQKGRYREFYQCDADIIGSDSLLNEVELILIYDEVFRRLRVGDITIKLNNRKILEGVADVTGTSDRFGQMTVILDKTDKIGIDGIREEFMKSGFSEFQTKEIIDLLNNSRDNFDFVANKLQSSQKGKEGLAELEYIKGFLAESEAADVIFDLTLARGLDYYTGTILEVKANNVSIGSIGGGGRYDDLTGVFGLPGVSGVGISFGLDRIYDVMEELGLFEEIALNTTKVLFANFDSESERKAFIYLQQLRDEGIKAEIYPSPEKLGKQFKYADARKIPYVILAGSEELKTGLLAIKNMQTGDQQKSTMEEIIAHLKSE